VTSVFVWSFGDEGNWDCAESVRAESGELVDPLSGIRGTGGTVGLVFGLREGGSVALVAGAPFWRTVVDRVSGATVTVAVFRKLLTVDRDR
jgi:hypothetical protein